MEIIFTDDDIFYKKNGFKYNDICRPEYRLSEEIYG